MKEIIERACKILQKVIQDEKRNIAIQTREKDRLRSQEFISWCESELARVKPIIHTFAYPVHVITEKPNVDTPEIQCRHRRTKAQIENAAIEERLSEDTEKEQEKESRKTPQQKNLF